MTPSSFGRAASAERRSRGDRHLGVVSYRLPVTHADDLGWQRSPGGLVSALTPALEQRSAVWFGHVDEGDPEPPARHDGVRLRGLELTARERAAAIDGACNRSLWPALHGIDDRIEQDDSWWEAYIGLAARNARRIADTAPWTSAVWVHDYHHLLLAQEIRSLRSDLRLGLFLHTPVVASSLARLDPAERLADGIAAFDVVATQTLRDAEQLGRFLGDASTERPDVLEAIPVGFDVGRWMRYRDDPVVTALAEREAAADGLLAVGVDRSDYTKGLVPKLEAIEMLLDDGRLDPDGFRLVQIATPTRVGIAAYDEVAARVDGLAKRVNARFSRTDGRRVIDLVSEPRPPREIAALMRASDIALVTPERDGMNLVALEYSAVNADRPTALVLGAGAGVASDLADAADIVDGSDARSIADTLVSLVDSAPDSAALWSRRARRRCDIASRFTAERWVDEFMSALDPYHGQRLIG